MNRVDVADVVVVGSGAAGLSAALAAADGGDESRILVITRGTLGRDGASLLAQGGVAAALHDEDSPELHALDTVFAGAGLSREDRVEILTTEGPDRVRELIRLGAHFDRDAGGELELAMEGAHSRRRVIHARGDRTGAEVTAVLARAVERTGAIRVLEGVEARELWVEDGQVVGLEARDADGRARRWAAGAVVLATGGPCHLYRRTTTPASSMGGGLAMAMRAGARVSDMEFVQFHPTAMAVDADPLPLVTEALRGEGARLVCADGTGVPFPEDGSALSTRDRVARVLWDRIRRGQPVFLDARSAPGAAFPDRFPGVFELCRRRGIDPRQDLIPVTPAAHYHMGGLSVDADGRTSLAGLWAAGEVASTGVHGANRLASNSLLEGLVFGARAGASAREAAGRRPPSSRDTRPESTRSPTPPSSLAALDELRTLLWERVGVIRDAEGLRHALSEMDRLAAENPDPALRPLHDAIVVGRAIVRGALDREESRGSHFRSDFPEPATLPVPTPSAPVRP